MALLPILMGFGSIVALTIGIMVQKSSLAAADLRAAGAIQHLGAAIVTGVLAAVMGSGAGIIRRRCGSRCCGRPACCRWAAPRCLFGWCATAI